MLSLAFRNLVRRPLRNGLAIAGLAVAVALLVCLSSFGNGYKRALSAEIDHMGLQLMLVPLGCPYDAAARVLKGKSLENSLPESALEQARRYPGQKPAAPICGWDSIKPLWNSSPGGVPKRERIGSVARTR